MAVPLVLLAAPTFVPVATLANSALRAGMILHRERTAVDWPGAGRLVLGQVPGLALGAVVVVLAPGRLLDALLAVAVLAAVPLNWRQRHRAVSGRAVVAVAVVSGAMTTIGSIGGPLLALLYQQREGRVIRGTLSAVFAVSAVLGLGVLAVAGAVGGVQMLDAAVLVPGGVVGTLLSGRIARRVDRPPMRPVVLTICTLAGLAALGHALLG